MLAARPAVSKSRTACMVRTRSSPGSGGLKVLRRRPSNSSSGIAASISGDWPIVSGPIGSSGAAGVAGGGGGAACGGGAAGGGDGVAAGRPPGTGRNTTVRSLSSGSRNGLSLMRFSHLSPERRMGRQGLPAPRAETGDAHGSGPSPDRSWPTRCQMRPGNSSVVLGGGAATLIWLKLQAFRLFGLSGRSARKHCGTRFLTNGGKFVTMQRVIRTPALFAG